MPNVEIAHYQDGDFLVNYEEKVFEDVKAEPGEKALLTFHTIAFEGSIGLVNMLQAKRLLRKGLRNQDPALRAWRTTGRATRFSDPGRRSLPWASGRQQPDQGIHGRRR